VAATVMNCAPVQGITAVQAGWFVAFCRFTPKR
jgi:hypothetical protein